MTVINNIMKFVFVFGSNTAGIHGAGAARTALNHFGAVWGEGEGHFGDSYALPTKEGIKRTLKTKQQIRDTLPLITIQHYVERFMAYARANPKLNFQVTRIGCGLAGLKDEDIASMFDKAPDNCYFDTAWRGLIGDYRHHKFWGTF